MSEWVLFFLSVSLYLFSLQKLHSFISYERFISENKHLFCNTEDLAGFNGAMCGNLPKALGKRAEETSKQVAVREDCDI